MSLFIQDGRIVVDEMTEISVSLDTYVANHGGAARFYIAFNAPGVEEKNYYSGSSIIIDGEETTTNTSSMYFIGTNDGLGFLLPYDQLEAGVTTAAGLQEQHTFTIPAGAIIGDKYRVAEDLKLIIKDGTVAVDNSTEITLSLDTYVANHGGAARFYIAFNAPGVEAKNYYPGSPIIIDGVETSTNTSSMYFIGTEDGLGFLLPYEQLEAGVTSADELQEEHTFMIPAGAMIGENYRVAEDFKLLIKDGQISEDTRPAGSVAFVSGYQATGTRVWTTMSGAASAAGVYLGTIKVDDVHKPLSYGFVDAGNMNDFLIVLDDVMASVNDGTVVTIEPSTFTRSGGTEQIVFNNYVVLTYDASNASWAVDIYDKLPSEEDFQTELTYWDIDHSGTNRYVYFYITNKETLVETTGTMPVIAGGKEVEVTWNKHSSGNAIFFVLTDEQLENLDTIVIKKGTKIGSCVAADTVCVQYDQSITADPGLGKELIVVNNTLATYGWQPNPGRYYLTMNAPGVPTGNTTTVAWELNGNAKTLPIFRFNDNEFSGYYKPDEIVTGATADDIVGATLVLRGGTIIGEYYLLNSIAVLLDGQSVTPIEAPGEGEEEDVVDNGLPNTVVKARDDNGRNDVRNAGNDFYFKTDVSDPLTIGANFAFTTGGIYINDSETPLAGARLYKFDGVYYAFLGNGYTLKPGDIITLDGVVESGKNRVKFGKSVFEVEATANWVDGVWTEINRISLKEDTTEYTTKLETAYIDLGDLGNVGVYTIPMGDLIKVNGTETTDRNLSKPGDYKIIRKNGHVTYEQTVVCYEIGDANADGEFSIKDLVAAKKSAQHTKLSEKRGADMTNDSTVDATDIALMRSVMLGKTTVEDIRVAYQDFVFGVISDTHITADNDMDRRDNFRKALTYYKSQNAKVIIINGDVSDLGTVKSYDLIVDLIDEIYPEGEVRPEFIFTGDNHEWFDAWDFGGRVPSATWEEVQKRFTDGLGIESTNTHIVAGGYDFVAISSDGMSGANASYKQTTFDFLADALEAAVARDANKPIFVAIHQPPSAGSRVYNILKDYPQVVLFTSHTHQLLNEERSIMQKDFTMVNTATTYYACVSGSYENYTDDYSREGYQLAQGLIVKVNNTNVNIDRWDFYGDEQIGKTWTFESKQLDKYTSARANEAVAPEFAAGTTVEAKWLTKTSCELTFAPAVPAEGDFVYRYKVEVRNSQGGLVGNYSFINFFWIKGEPETLSYEIPGLDCESEYTFKVTAEETYGNASEAIQTNIAKYSDIVSEGSLVNGGIGNGAGEDY